MPTRRFAYCANRCRCTASVAGLLVYRVHVFTGVRLWRGVHCSCIFGSAFSGTTTEIVNSELKVYLSVDHVVSRCG